MLNERTSESIHKRQIDIGFGDEIVAGPVDMDYPATLDFPAPNIRVYSLESAIAEKFQAIVNLGIFGSRMKDYYDIWFLIKKQPINKSTLSEALETTFKNRKTPVSDAVYIFSAEFKDSTVMQQQWLAFINRTGIDANTSFAETINDLESFFMEILAGK